MLRGVFIGIDRYSAPVSRLSCGRADAAALGSLFKDTLGGKVQIIADADATKARILRAIADLMDAVPDDLVVISYSGHGTESHELVPVDVDPDNLATSCIPLTQLAELLDEIPVKQLLVILDCCFSGGFGGARVFAPNRTRGTIEDRSAVTTLASGSGRIVITASGAGEPALETAEFGHGLLSYFLIDGLQGSAGGVSNGRVPLLEVFQFTLQRTVDAARKLSHQQTPTLYGSVEGAPTISVLVPGAAFATEFPGRTRPPVTSSWESLKPYRLPEASIESWANTMPGLNNLQIEAINNHGVLDGRSLLVVAPTGAGKTMIGELAALQAVGSRSRAVMLLPLRALVNDKYEGMTRTYGDGLTVVRATGEHSDQVGALLSGHFDIALLTYEKFMGLMLGFPHMMRGLSTIVVDEVQTISDLGRGVSLEFVLTLLRAGHGRSVPPQVVALSAVIGDTSGMERWLGGGLLRTETRPVPLREAVIDRSGAAQVRNPDGSVETLAQFIHPEAVAGSQSNKPWLIPLVRRLVQEGKKVIVFRSRRGDTVGAARYLAASLGLPPATEALQRLPQADQSSSATDLQDALQGGVGFHNADLDRDERIILEETFRDPASHLRVLVATTTLAMGVNTPAEAVVIAGLEHPFGNPYSVAEYKNMSGRAGRPGLSDAGESYIIATDNPGPSAAWTNYVQGKPEAVISHFLSESTDPQTLLIRNLVALGSSVREEGLINLLESSFAIWQRTQQGLQGWDRVQLTSNLDALVAAQLVDREPNGNLTLTALGRYAGESGLEVRSVTQVASALRFAPAVLSGADLVTLAQVTVEVDALYIPSNRRSHQEQQRWPRSLVQLGSPQLVSSLHVGGGEAWARAKRGVACLLFMSERPLADIERELLQHTRDRSAAGQIRAVASRTRDVLDAVAQIAAYYQKEVPESISADLGLRLELGIPEKLVDLARVVGASLTRGEYLTLLQQNILTPEQVRAADGDLLKRILGKNRADVLRTTVALPS